MTIQTQYNIGDMVQPSGATADEQFEVAEIHVATAAVGKEVRIAIIYRRKMGCWFAEGELRRV
jgi:hypothetical protein